MSLPRPGQNRNPVSALPFLTPLAHIWRLVGRQKCAIENTQAAAVANDPAAHAEAVTRANAIGLEAQKLLMAGNVLAPLKRRSSVPRIRVVEPPPSKEQS